MNLMAHQINGVDFLIKNKGVGALFYDVGTGKTLTALSAYMKLKEKDNSLKLLVICPLSLIKGAWIKEIEKHFPELNWIDHHGKEHKVGCWKDIDAQIHIVNFDYLLSDKKFGSLEIILKWGCNWMCVVDESSKMKSYNTQTTKMILSLSKYFNHRVLCSGSPAPNIEWEYWGQMLFLSPSILGDHFFKFRSRYFRLARGKQIIDGYMPKDTMRDLLRKGFKYEIKPSMREDMLTRMKPYCQFVKARDCMDLPEEIDEYRIIEMDEKHRKLYNTMKEEYILELKNTVPNGESDYAVANIALVKFLKLRQITSSCVISEKGEVIRLGTTPKLDALMDIVEECGDKQLIIWANFHFEIDMIVKALEKISPVSQLHGRIPESERITHLNDFLEGRTRFLVANPHSAGHGLTMVNANIQIFYSIDYSSETYLQARGRTMRYGQKNNCVYFHILCANSIDEDVLALVQKKMTASQIVEKYLRTA
jgi:SNF2 family DNA or RNA helicase